MSIELLRKLGMYVDEAFLCPETCKILCEEMDASSHTKAGVFNDKGESCDDDEMRQTLYAKVSKRLHREVNDKVVALKSGT